MRNIIVVVLSMFLSSSCITFNLVERQYIHKSLTLEIQPTIHHNYDMQELESAKQYLDVWKICHAEDIQLMIHPPVANDRFLWTTGDAIAFEMTYRRQYSSNAHPSLYISYVMGSYTGRLAGIIGVNYDSDGILIFSNDYRDSHRLAVLLHEILHAVGLVRLDRDIPPVNPNRPRHCNDPTCTMFWIVPSIPKLCELCKTDLRLMIH